MALAAVALVSSSALAWNPDTDAALLFNMNFETYNNAAHTATDAKAGLVGTLVDYNTTYPNVFGETGRAGLGVDANFAEIHDEAPGKGVPEGNDVKLTMPPTSVFNLGEVANKHTWTFWFNVSALSQGTIIRHANIWLEYEGYENLVWEIRIEGGKLQFYHKNNSLRMETASTLSELGVDANTWHSAAVVIDRTDTEETTAPTTQLSTKIYIDGLEAPIIITSTNDSSMNVDAAPYNSPLWIGAGDREFDGLLDDVRLFSRVLTPLEVSILNQPDNTIPRALLPIPRSSNVAIATNVTWEPATGNVTAQKVYFGTDPCNLPLKKSGDGSLNQVTNAELGGPFPFNTNYYWYIKSTIDSVDSNGPLWSFTTETGRALNPSPYDGEEDVDVNDVNLSWTTTTAATYAVYLSKERTLVEANDPCVRIADGISVTQVNDVNTSSRGAIYYWRVNSTYPEGNVPGDIWSFRTKPYELVFNTSGAETTYADHVIPAYAFVIHQDGWSDVCATGFLASDGVAIFNFPSGFNYDRRYDIIAVPEYRATDVNEIRFPTPLAIHVTGDFSFDGRIQIAGDDILTTTQYVTFARSGGFAGPKHNQDISVFHNRTVDIALYWDRPTMPANNHGRYGLISSGKSIFIPTALAKSVFGPGQPVNPPYKGGGGGGSGGGGGEAGRGYFFGIFSGGPSYGDKEVPVPFGGSAGGWGGGTGGTTGGAAGGGGIEIVATGNVVLDTNSQIIANGGGQLCSAVNYPAGGGGGGSVRIIAGGSVTNKGIINVNGGKGGNGNRVNNENDTGGGGGGGRVAIFYSTTYSNTGNITANGGERGTNAGVGLAQDGQDGTILVTNGSPKKASAPTPKNGDSMVYCNPDPCTITLKWYSGYGGSTDVVYFGTNTNPADPCGTVSATRGQHDVNVTVSSGKTYYWKVVTDGAVSSDIWSFKTVNWQCPFAIDGNAPHVGGPEWDWNHDCVLNFKDFSYFAKDWFNSEFGPYMLDNTYVGGLPSDGIVSDLARFANEWLDCYNRTNGGCAGW
jgi:hypothetical protein